VVVGIGAVPNTDWLTRSATGSRLTITASGVHCDPTGRAAPHVWAVGDVSAWQVPGADAGVVERHEHWTAASDQARVVAQNIVDGAERTCTGPAYVWSDQFGLRINIIGTPGDHDEVRFLSRDAEDLAALHAREGRLVGACIVGQPRLMAQCRSWTAQRRPVGDVPVWASTGADLVTTRSES
jgi:3-phenylpropionate/trans-cinnamate dioxygenase ferredoxin reductase subunit